MFTFKQLIYRKASSPLGNGKNSRAGAESFAVVLSARQQAEYLPSVLCCPWINLMTHPGRPPGPLVAKEVFRGEGVGCFSGFPGFCAHGHPALMLLS